MVGVHPSTGRRYLYVNAGFTESIVGLHAAESEALLRLLVAHAANPNFQYRHHWRLGDVVVWDERCTQHFAVADYLPERREMGRAVVRRAERAVGPTLGSAPGERGRATVSE